MLTAAPANTHATHHNTQCPDKQEMARIYTCLHMCSQLRQKYMTASLQQPGDNPKDQEDWRIYPRAPEPYWIPGDDHHEGREVHPEEEEFCFKDCAMPPAHEVNASWMSTG